MSSRSAAPAPPTAPQRPWWLPHFLGRIPAVEEREIRVLGLVTLGMVFENYDLSLINSAIKQISDDLGIAIGDSGFYLGSIRLGGLLAFAIVPFADRFGRRRIFLLSLIGMSVGTLLSGLSQTPVQFVLAQIVSRAFLLTCVAMSIVILTEEFPAEHRGWAIGTMSAMGGLGYAVGVGMFAAIDVLPWGWRSLYAFGIVPLALLPMLRRNLTETRRFAAHAESGAVRSAAGFRGLWQPVASLIGTSPRRIAGVGLAGLCGAAGGIGVFQYTALFVQEAHGFEPWQYAAMLITGGAIGILGNVVGGRLGDRLGRRRIGFLAMLFFPAASALFYHGPEGILWVAFGCIVFCNAAMEVILRAFAGELFATSHRGAATGFLVGVQTTGWSLGLFLVALGSENLEELVWVVTTLAGVVALGGIGLLLLPETRGRELEELSPGA